jgi:hypothetical protein
MTWDSFVKRRNIDIKRFLTTNCITSRAGFFAHLMKIEVDPPSEDVIERIFPTPAPSVERVEITTPKVTWDLPKATISTGELGTLKSTSPQEEKTVKKTNNNNTKK